MHLNNKINREECERIIENHTKAYDEMFKQIFDKLVSTRPNSLEQTWWLTVAACLAAESQKTKTDAD